MQDRQENEKEKKRLEEQILNLLQKAKGSEILDDEQLLNTLSESKENSKSIEEKMNNAKVFLNNI